MSGAARRGEALPRDHGRGVLKGMVRETNGTPLKVGSTDLSQRPISEQLLNNVLTFTYSPRNVAGLVPSEGLLEAQKRIGR